MNKSLILVLAIVVVIASVAMGDKRKSLLSSSSGHGYSGSICGLPKLQGHCYASITRYHYDMKKGKCKSFRYGGCGGNANNFASKSECQRACRGRSG